LTKALYGKEPDCEGCFPELLFDNVIIVELYNLCAHQIIVSAMGDLIDLDYNAVFKVMEMKRINNPKLQDYYLKQMKQMFYVAKDKQEEKRERDKTKGTK
jgi:hypothetical protein